LKDDELEEVAFIKLAKLLHKQKLSNINDIDKLFNPSDYLVSPFNSTKKFIENKYFLTHQQESVKVKIIDVLEDNTKANFFAVIGGAGTGKTLLTYDIAKEMIKNAKKVLVIHCGYLNDGQSILNSKYNWKIIEIKHYKNYKLSDYDLIIVDEAQRIYSNQFQDIVKKIEENNGNCIFSYDKVQILSTWEEKNNIDNQINKIPSIKSYKLSEKIRTNKSTIMKTGENLTKKTN